MKLKSAQIKTFRSIIDTGPFEIEQLKTIIVGPNEAGKTAALLALEAVNPPQGKGKFDWLRDYPRSRLNEIQLGKVKPSDVTVTEVVFALDENERQEIAEINPLLGVVEELVVGRKLDNERWLEMRGGPMIPVYKEVKKDLENLKDNIKDKMPLDQINQLDKFVAGLGDEDRIDIEISKPFQSWLGLAEKYVEDGDVALEKLGKLREATKISLDRAKAIGYLEKHIPLFVYFNNYFQVRPSIHLRQLATRLAGGVLDDDAYDYGNKCLLQLLGFTAKELADVGDTPEPAPDKPAELQRYKDQLDKRHYSLNAAQVALTDAIQEVWIGEEEEEKLRLRLHADKQYLKVVVEDELGVEVELDQRSAGFQWLVSFFIVFQSQAKTDYKNAILLLDEPGLSLHGLKQRQFRKTVKKLSVDNQTIYTTHSPFMVGPDELPIVRVAEMTNRKVGTKIHTQITADDPRSLFPLQEALGYDLAQSLFSQQKNLVCEGLTDNWYLEGCASLLRDAGIADLDQKIAFVPANTASKVIYYATILHSQKLKVAALLDSDQAGEQAATQDHLVMLLGDKLILRTKDVYKGNVDKPEIEDILRESLITIARDDLKWDVTAKSKAQPKRPIVDIFEEVIPDFSKYKLAKAFLRWVSQHNAADLPANERQMLSDLIKIINKVLK